LPKKKSLIYSDFFAFVQRYAITAPKQLAMAVAAPAVVGDLIAVADTKAVFGAVAPDRTLHEPRKRLGEGAIELPSVDVGGEKTENVSAPAGPIAPVAVRMRRRACPRAVERVLTAEMRSKVPVALHAATSGPASRLFNV
jgi:hypothetical protein